MSDKFTFSSAGQIHELEMGMDRVGDWDNRLVKKLSEGNFLGDVRDVLLGRSEIRPIEYLIDCDAPPFIPEGLKVTEHQKLGLFKYAPARMKFYLSDAQRRDTCNIRGTELREKLRGKPVMNANILDFILKHPHTMPDEFGNGRIIVTFFWGTLFSDSDGHLFVGGLWRESALHLRRIYRQLDGNLGWFDCNDRAALRG